MNDITELQVKEALNEALQNQSIDNYEYKAIMQALQEGSVNPSEIFYGFLPFKESYHRHR